MWVTAEQQRQLDDLYKGFGDLESWFGRDIDALRWSSSADSLVAVRAAAGEATWRQAVEHVARAGQYDVSLLPGPDGPPLASLKDTQSSLVQAAISGGREGVKALYDAEVEVRRVVFELAGSEVPIEEDTIRRLHMAVSCNQEGFVIADHDGSAAVLSLPKGEYKAHPNYGIGMGGVIFPFAPVDRTSSEVRGLVGVLASPLFDSAHPVLKAAYALDALLRIHPFADGNGRVARALASVYLCRQIGIPLIFPATRRKQYLGAVRSRQHDGLGQPLVDFVFQRSVEAMAGVRTRLQV